MSLPFQYKSATLQLYFLANSLELNLLLNFLCQLFTFFHFSIGSLANIIVFLTLSASGASQNVLRLFLIRFLNSPEIICLPANIEAIVKNLRVTDSNIFVKIINN